MNEYAFLNISIRAFLSDLVCLPEPIVSLFVYMGFLLRFQSSSMCVGMSVCVWVTLCLLYRRMRHAEIAS